MEEPCSDGLYYLFLILNMARDILEFLFVNFFQAV
jgi:hypothetical protein